MSTPTQYASVAKSSSSWFEARDARRLGPIDRVHWHWSYLTDMTKNRQTSTSFALAHLVAVLATRADEGGVSWYSWQGLARGTGMSFSYVRRCTGVLLEEKWLEILPPGARRAHLTWCGMPMTYSPTSNLLRLSLPSPFHFTYQFPGDGKRVVEGNGG